MLLCIDKTGNEGNVLRSYIRRKRIGCNGVKLRFHDGVQHHGTHMRRSVVPAELLRTLDSGMHYYSHQFCINIIIGIYPAIFFKHLIAHNKRLDEVQTDS
jgi:hypothetical protein